MTPDSTALAGTGATGCASGSHMCSSGKPTFTPRPAISKASVTGPWAVPAMASKRSPPAACTASSRPATSSASPSTAMTR